MVGSSKKKGFEDGMASNICGGQSLSASREDKLEPSTTLGDHHDIVGKQNINRRWLVEVSWGGKSHKSSKLSDDIVSLTFSSINTTNTNI